MVRNNVNVKDNGMKGEGHQGPSPTWLLTLGVYWTYVITTTPLLPIIIVVSTIMNHTLWMNMSGSLLASLCLLWLYTSINALFSFFHYLYSPCERRLPLCHHLLASLLAATVWTLDIVSMWMGVSYPVVNVLMPQTMWVVHALRICPNTDMRLHNMPWALLLATLGWFLVALGTVILWADDGAIHIGDNMIIYCIVLPFSWLFGSEQEHNNVNDPHLLYTSGGVILMVASLIVSEKLKVYERSLFNRFHMSTEESEAYKLCLGLLLVSVLLLICRSEQRNDTLNVKANWVMVTGFVLVSTFVGAIVECNHDNVENYEPYIYHISAILFLCLFWACYLPNPNYLHLIGALFIIGAQYIRTIEE